MRPSTLPALLALLALSAAPFAQTRRWDPLFDYTNLRPTDVEQWGAVSPLPVTMQAAVAAARASEQTIHVLKAGLEGKEQPVWRFELIAVSPEGNPKRVDLTVSALEPKVVKRTELEALLPADEEAWRMFQKHHVPLDDAIQVGNESLNKVPDKKIIVDGHAVQARFVPVQNGSRWELEVLAMDSKHDVPRRYQVFVSAKDPVMQRVVLEDRYPGEPLRAKGEPVQHPSGLYVFDLRDGDGPKVAPDSKVRVQYRLFLLDGTKIHDTWEKRRPETFALAEAPLKGITQALPDMRVGGRRKIIIPYESAFGETGSVRDEEGNVSEVAPPKATIVCDIDVEALVSD
jgi:hypothetical protein